MRKKWLPWIIAGMCTIILATHSDALGQGGVNLGGFEAQDSAWEGVGGKVILKTRISTSARYDTNFFNSHENEHEAMTYTVSPGITIGYETAKSEILFDYETNARFYDHLDDIPEGVETAREDAFTGHLLKATARTQPTARLFFGIEEAFYRTLDTGYSDRFGQPVEREAITVNRLTPSVIYKFGEKFTTGVKYRNTLTEYDRPDVDDSTGNAGMVDLIYHFNATTSMDLNYQRQYMDYDGATIDYTSDQVGAYLQKEFSHTTFSGGVGYHRREFDEQLDEMEAFTYGLDVRWQKARSHVLASVERNFNEYGDRSNSYYEATLFTLEAGRTFLEKISTGIAARYLLSDFDEADREDDVYEIAARLGYIYTDWLTFDLQVGYEERDSNQDFNDYENEFILLGLRSAYDFGSR